MKSLNKLGIRCPSRILWRVWSFDDKEYEKSFSVQNITQRTLKLDVVAPDGNSSFTFNGTKNIKLFPGMTTNCTVTFVPTKGTRLSDSIELRCMETSFRITLEASPPVEQSRVMLPSAVSFGNVAVNESETQTIRVTNAGSIQTTGSWYCKVPFSVTSEQLDLSNGGEEETVIVFSPKKAGVHSQVLTLHCDDDIYRIKVTGVAKYPVLQLNTNKVDFGPVTCGKQFRKSICVKNIGPVSCSYEIAVAASGCEMETATEISPTEGRIKPGESVPLMITLNPRCPGMRLFKQFKILTTSSESLYITVTADVQLNRAELSSSSIEFRTVNSKETAEEEVFLINKSLDHARFQLVELNHGPFAVQPSSGTLEKNTSILLKVYFQPNSSSLYHQRIIVLIQNGNPIFLDLYGYCEKSGGESSSLNCATLAGNLEGKTKSTGRVVEPEEVNLEKSTLVKKDVWNCFFSSKHSCGTLEASESCLNFGSTSASKGIMYKLLTITNHASFSQKVHLSLSCPISTYNRHTVSSPFKAVPIEKEIKAGEEETFHLRFKPDKDGLYFAAQCDVNIIPKDPIATPTVNPALSVQLIGNSFLYLEEPTTKDIHFSHTDVHFPPVCTGGRSYADLLVTNKGSEAAFLEFQIYGEECFVIKPQFCTIHPHSTQLVCFQFSPTTSGEFKTKLLCILNNHTADPRSLTMKGKAYEPSISLFDNNPTPSVQFGIKQDEQITSLTFRPTVIGRVSKRVIAMRNDTGISVPYLWELPRQTEDKTFTIDQRSGLLSPCEIRKQIFNFHPQTTGHHDMSVRCLVGNTTDHFNENNKARVVQMQGEGTFQLATLSPRAIQADTIRVFHPFKTCIEIKNCCSDYLDYELEAIVDGEAINLTSYNREEENLIDTSQTKGYKLMLQNPTGAVSPWSRIKLAFVLWCYNPQTLIFYIHNKKTSQTKMIQLGSKEHNNTSILQFYCKAEHPTVIISDIFSSGLSKKLLWHSMSLDKLNGILQESVSKEDIQNSQDLEESLDYIKLNSLQTVIFDFGKHYLGSKKCNVVFELFNLRDLSTHWRLRVFSPHEEHLEPWVLPLIPRTPEEEFRSSILEDNIFSWNVDSGQVLPKQRQTLILSYNPVLEGNHKLDICFDITDGKQMKLSLRGTTNRDKRAELILAPYMEIGVLPIGCNPPTIHLLPLLNVGTCEANYELDLTEMQRLNEENDFEVFALLGNQTGEVESKSSIPLPVVFNPIEEKSYEVTLPLIVDGLSSHSITLKGQGIHPKHLVLERQNQEGLSVPMLKQETSFQTERGRKALMSSVLRVSTQVISFGKMEPKKSHRQLVEITNQSDSSLYFEVDATNVSTALQGKTRIVPDKGILLQLNHTKNILFEYIPSEQSEIFSSDVYLKVTSLLTPSVEDPVEEESEEEILAIHPLPNKIRKDQGSLKNRLPVHLASTVSFQQRFDQLETKSRTLSLVEELSNDMEPRPEPIVLQLVGEVQCGMHDSQGSIHVVDDSPYQNVANVVEHLISSILIEDDLQQILENIPRQLQLEIETRIPSDPRKAYSTDRSKTPSFIEDTLEEIIRDVIGDTN